MVVHMFLSQLREQRERGLHCNPMIVFPWCSATKALWDAVRVSTVASNNLFVVKWSWLSTGLIVNTKAGWSTKSHMQFMILDDYKKGKWYFRKLPSKSWKLSLEVKFRICDPWHISPNLVIRRRLVPAPPFLIAMRICGCSSTLLQVVPYLQITCTRVLSAVWTWVS